MALLFDQQLHNQLDQNGGEELAETSPAWYTFEGTGKELARGARNIGVFYSRAAEQTDDTAATALGVNQYLTPDGNVAKIHDIPPKPEADLPKYSKPDHQNSSASAIILGSFLEQAPTILSAVVNPALGGLQGATFGASMAVQEAEERGLTGDARKWFIGITAIEDGIGGALPGVGGIGEGALLKYGSRFLVGGTLNEVLSEGGRYSRAEVLERYGYAEQAAQMRQWDAQVALSNFIVGGFFNLAGGRARDRVDGDGITADAIDAAQEYNRARIDPDTVDAATHAALHDNYVTESAPGLATSPRAESVHVDALGDAVDAFENGRAVDVSRHFADEPEFIARPDHGLDAGSAERQTLTGSALAQVDEVLRRADEQGLSQSTPGTTRNAPPESPPGQLSDVVDNPFDVLREQAEALRATHPELTKELLPHIDEIQAEHTRLLAEAQQYEIAAACAVINGV